MCALMINMKFVALSVILAAITYAASSKVELKEGIVPKKLPPIEIPVDVISTEEWANLKSTVLTLDSELGTASSGHVEANVTDYALQLLANVQNLIIQDGLDPLELSDQYINLIDLGYVNITDGWLQQLSTITLSGDVIAKYSMSTHILEVTIPIAFDNLLISYDYHTQVLLLSIKGTVDAQVENVRLNLKVGFNFSSYHAFVDKADVTNTGTVTLVITGLGLLDWIFDLLTDTFTAVFHGIILSVVDLIIQVPVEQIVNDINDAIDSILTYNSTASAS